MARCNGASCNDTSTVLSDATAVSVGLSDVTNTTSSSTGPPPAKRSRRVSAAKASSTITSQMKCQSPRGMHTAKSKPALPEETFSLQKLIQIRPDVLQEGMTCLQQYIERNTTFAMKKAFALSIFSRCICSGIGIMDACDEAAMFTDFSSQVIRKWATECFVNYFSNLKDIDDATDETLDVELSSNRGRHPKVISLMFDENFRMELKQYVHNNGYVKGKPNLSLSQVVSWVMEKWGAEICEETARVWMHKLGFTYRQFSKGVYFDGHERADVIQDRKEYVATMSLYESRFLTAHSPTLSPQCTQWPVIRLFHDESTFHSNADQAFHWSDGSTQALKQKSLGQAIMVSDFVEEVGGLLEFGGKKARLLLEHKTEGYFTNDMLLVQVNDTIDIFEMKYPETQGMFIFDNAPSHMKKPEDALNPEKMNVSDGGKQPFVQDTEWNGMPQPMTLENGEQKGMKRVLQERGVDTHGMNADKMRERLKEFADFNDKTTLLEQAITSRGHLCVYLPKFHCELNPIERCWCHAKKYTRAHCNGSIIRLRKIVPEAFDTISMDLISRFFLTCTDYEKAYKDGHSCVTVDAAVKVYKSHRRVQSVNS